jgi:hypothetical protein
MITAYKACPLKAFYGSFVKIRPKQVSVHLNAGKAFADGMHVFRQLYYSGEMNFEDARQEAVKSIIISYGDFEPEEKDAGKSWDRTVGALLYALKVYPPEQDILRPTMLNGKVASEFSFAEPLDYDLLHPDTGDPILYTGRLDTIMEMGAKANLFGFDDKTTKQLGATWPDQWDLRSQFPGYVWGAKSYGIDLQGMVVRGIKILKTVFDHAQVIVYCNDWMIDRWKESTIFTVKQMIRDYEAGYWDSNLSDSCTSYGGCEFKRLCCSPNPDAWIEPYYETNLWNPLTGEDDPAEVE